MPQGSFIVKRIIGDTLETVVTNVKRDTDVELSEQEVVNYLAEGDRISRISQIKQELSSIDNQKIRPASAITNAMAKGLIPNQGDLDRLTLLDEQVTVLRDELSQLQ